MRVVSAFRCPASEEMPELTVAIASEIDPPLEKKRRGKPSKKNSTPSKRGPARPYRKITDEVLSARIKRLTDRMERAKKQHESARGLLTKYSREHFYRDQEAIKNSQEDQATTLEPLDDQGPALALAKS